MAKRRLVTLLTDFGSADPYVAAMKGTILQYCPMADIVDISHNIPPHQILHGAFVLANSAPCFPEGTLHVVVVDPGVGTDRAILVGQFGGHLFLFPDNGVISLIKQMLPLEGIVSVRNEKFLPHTSEISHTFHGRDIFAPLAGHILNGVDISNLGPAPSRYKLLDMPTPQEENGELIGRIIYVDHFGNLISNISQEDLRRRWASPEALQVQCNGQPVGKLAVTYGHVAAGKPLALFNSMGLVEVAVNFGQACDMFKAGVGAEVRIRETKYLDVDA
ncbi:MAG: SAM-dependent chlorinase/fluorinase [Phycisphaerae bacterium]|nr:SAM-dependent chlorinase/fluorinase [Phycisphaerae bacterium]